MKTAEQNTTSTTQRRHQQQPGGPFLKKDGEGVFFSENAYQFLSPFGGKEYNTPFFSQSNIQAKLTIGQSGDPSEQEADAMADKVVSHPSENRSNFVIGRNGGPSAKTGNNWNKGQPENISKNLLLLKSNSDVTLDNMITRGQVGKYNYQKIFDPESFRKIVLRALLKPYLQSPKNRSVRKGEVPYNMRLESYAQVEPRYSDFIDRLIDQDIPFGRWSYYIAIAEVESTVKEKKKPLFEAQGHMQIVAHSLQDTVKTALNLGHPLLSARALAILDNSGGEIYLPKKEARAVHPRIRKRYAENISKWNKYILNNQFMLFEFMQDVNLEILRKSPALKSRSIWMRTFYSAMAHRGGAGSVQKYMGKSQKPIEKFKQIKYYGWQVATRKIWLDNWIYYEVLKELERRSYYPGG